jgi:hypothetical protein
MMTGIGIQEILRFASEILKSVMLILLKGGIYDVHP